MKTIVALLTTLLATTIGCGADNPAYRDPGTDAGAPELGTILPDAQIRNDATPFSDATQAADATPEPDQQPAILGTMSIKVGVGNTVYKSMGTSALGCSCTMTRSKSTGTLVLGCIGSTIGAFCNPTSGPGWAVYLPKIKAGTANLTTGQVGAKVWGITYPPANFTGDYALIKDSNKSAFPSTIKVQVAGKTAAIEMQAHMWNVSEPNSVKAVIINLDLHDVPIGSAP